MERSRTGRGSRTKIYYCHPYSAYERGTNENLNRMIRRPYPKGTDFGKVRVRDIKATERWMNEYPRGIFGYRSSSNMYNAEIERLQRS